MLHLGEKVKFNQVPFVKVVLNLDVRRLFEVKLDKNGKRRYAYKSGQFKTEQKEGLSMFVCLKPKQVNPLAQTGASIYKWEGREASFL